MTTQPRFLKTSVLIAALFAGGLAQAVTTSTKAEYDAAKTQIKADYKTDKTACDKFSANAKDVCEEQAKGKEKVALAELEYNHSGKPADANKVAVAKADATYDVAKEMCDDKSGNDKDICVTQAKADHTKALADAKMRKQVSSAKTEAAGDKRDADYKVAAEKCDSLAGDAKSACVADAKARYGKS